MTRHVHAVDWDRTLAYAAAERINIVSRVPGTDEPLPEETRLRIAAERTGAADAPPTARRRPTGGGGLGARASVPGLHAQLGPDLSLELTDGGTISILPSDTLVARRPQPRGHHRPEACSSRAGPASAAGGGRRAVDRGRRAACAPPGSGCRCPTTSTAGFRSRSSAPRSEQAAAARRRHRLAGSAEEPGGLELDPDEEAAVLERLRALGYVE